MGMRRFSPLSMFLVVVFCLGVFLRLYRIPQTLQFLGDQGRDAMIARAILLERDPAFIGPVTSVGNMYLGPLYYYFMVIPLMFTYPDPVGPAYAVAILGCVTLALVYLLGKEMVGKRAASLAFFLYAIAPVVITNVRFSWNPNIVPLFALLLLYHLNKAWRGNDRSWIWVGLLYAILFQLHYITLALAGFAGMVWLAQLLCKLRQRLPLRPFLGATGIAAAIFLASLTPILIYDTAHNWLNTRAFFGFFSSDGQHFHSARTISGLFYSFIGIAVRLLTEMYKIQIPAAAAFVSAGVLAYLTIRSVVVGKKDAHTTGRRMIALAFFFSVAVLTLYRGSIFDHYLGFVFPIAFLFAGILLDSLLRNVMLWPLVVGVMGLFVYQSAINYPGLPRYNTATAMTKTVAMEIAKRAGEDTYDIVLLADHRDAQGLNYRYFLTTGKNAPATEEQVGEFRKLFIIDEQHREEIIDTTQYKVSLWPNRTIVDDFTLPGGPRVVMLQR